MADLDKLGDRHKKLLRELEEIKAPLHDAIRAARAAGMTQNEIRDRSGYKTIQQIRVITKEAKEAKR